MSEQIVTVQESEDRLMGEQLTAQYQRAIGGLMEVLKFGAMMIQLKDQITVSARGHGGRFGDPGTGLKAWMDQYAPDISRPTAYRFMRLAEGLREEFKLGVRCDLVRLLSAPVEELEPRLAKRRAQIEEFLEGKSQRQLQLEFDFGVDDPKRRGGHHPAKPMDPEERMAEWARLAHEDSVAIFRDLEILVRGDKWKVLSDAELDGAIEKASDALDALTAWRRTPKRDRSIPDLARHYSELPPRGKGGAR